MKRVWWPVYNDIHGVRLFQGYKSETESVNTKSVVQHVIRYQVLLAAHYKADTKYCCCRATCLSGHIVDFTTHALTICVRYQVLLVTYYKADTKCCCCRATCCQVPLLTSLHTHTHTHTHTSTVCIRYQVLLAAYYKVDTKYCCCRATCLSGHIVDFTSDTLTVCIRYQVLLVAYYKEFWT
jgi:hypothetical protein